MRTFSPKNKIGGKHGFTFVEILVAVAIIGVLSMIAIPGIAKMQRVLKSTEMESGARQIYIAVQNRLTVMKSAGTLGSVDPKSTPSLLTEGRVFWIAQDHMPLDYDNTESTWNGEELCYVVGKNSDGSATAGKIIADTLLSEGSAESTLLRNYSVIEYNPSNGMVYGVFYSDEYFLYSEVCDTDRTKSTLRNIQGQPTVGYYGGTGTNIPDVQAANPVDSAFVIENGEKLLIRIVPEFTKSYTLKIESKSDPATFNDYTYTFTGNQTDFTGYPNISTEAGTNDIIIVLDSLTAGMRFADLFQNSIERPAVAPGSDIRITLSAEDVGGSSLSIPSQTTKVTNSLFASRSLDSVTLSSNRHLQNLEPTISGVSGVTGATLLSSLNWDNSEAALFKPITNAQLISFAGGGNNISNLAVTVNGERCGLFGEFGGTLASPGVISGISLVDPTLYGATADYVGSLAGYVHNATITKCNAYVQNSGLASNGMVTATAADGVGGLVGLSNNNAYSYCFASLADITATVKGSVGTSGVGGFAGISANDTISNSYSNTTQITVATLGTYTYTGGFVGRAGSTISYSYSLGNIKQTGGTAAAGFLFDFGGNASNCYSATTFTGTSGLSGYSYGFSNRASINCSYYSGASPSYTILISGITPRDLTGLQSIYSGTYWRTPTIADTHPYDNITFIGQAYPVSLIPTLAHYGNWPVASNLLIEIGNTDIWRPNVEIPVGKIMVFTNDEYVFLTPADILGSPVDGDKILPGGSLYVPESAGTLVINSNQTISWNITGDIVVEPNITTRNGNIEVDILSKNGDVIINAVRIIGNKSDNNPYIVNIAADNGNIKADGAIIKTKADSNGIINLVAQNDIIINGAQLQSAGDHGINIQSLAGSINADDAAITATGGSSSATVILQSAGFINLNRGRVASRVGVTINSIEAISANSSNISVTDSKKDINIISLNSGIDLSSAIVSSKSGSVYITTSKDISIISATITASTNSGEVLNFIATGIDSTLWVNGATVKGKSITAKNLTIVGNLASGKIVIIH